MQISLVFKNQFVLFVIVLLVSFGLVGTALAAVDQTGRSVMDSKAMPLQSAANVQLVVLEAQPPSPISNSEPVSQASPKREVWSFMTIAEEPGAFGKITPDNGAIEVPINPTLSWEESSGALYYEGCYDATIGDTCDTSWIPLGGLVWGLSQLDYGTTYYWQIRAGNGQGTTEADGGTWWSFTTIAETFSKIAPANGATDIPINLTLSWDVSPAATSYEYCFAQTDYCMNGWVSVGSNTSVVLSGLYNNTTYYWQVRAVNDGGNTYANEGTWWSFTTIVEAPGVFSKIYPVEGASGTETSPTLDWEDSLHAVSYEYCYDLTNDNTCDNSWTSSGSSTYAALSGLSLGTSYYWQVRANNAGGTTYANGGTWWSFTTLDVPNSFNKIAPANGAIDLPTNLTLNWGLTNTTIYEYCVDQTDNDECDGEWIYRGMPPADLSGLANGTTYYWQVRATNDRGTTYADGGTWWSFTTKPIYRILLPIVTKSP